MPSPEYLYHPRPDVPMLETAQPATSPRMQEAITQLALRYGVDLFQQGASLAVDMPDQSRRWLIGNIDGQRIGVTRCWVDAEDLMSPDLDMVFAVSAAGWEPREILHTPAVWEAYAHAMQTNGHPVADAHSDFNFATFIDFMAQDLEQYVAPLGKVQ
jgi:hypothetical protein